MQSVAQAELDAILDEDLASVRDREQHTFDRLIAKFGNRLVLFGVGNLGRTALSCLRSAGLEPLAFCDNNPALWGTAVQGLTVLSPEEASLRFGSSAAFFVTIWSLRHRFGETREKLNRLGSPNVFQAAPLRWKFSNELLPFFCQDFPHKVYEEAADVKRAAALWSDAKSSSEYLAQVKWRALGDHALASPDSEESYFPASIFRLSTDEEFVDCGAYDGDTIRAFIHRLGHGFRQMFAFEPDPVNYAKLEEYKARLDPDLQSKITLRNLAVGAARMRLRFNATGTEGAALSSDGGIVVECVSLDEVLSETKPTYLKMDIEGAEYGALTGAQHTIRRHQPVLALCVYHRQNDLWRLPLLIHSIYPDYRFFLRAHDVDGWQTVCYAVPPERCHII